MRTNKWMAQKWLELNGLRGKRSYTQDEFYKALVIALNLIEWAQKPWYRRFRRPF